ncbi:hypothetical protein [Spirosoma foliorum]|uniref:Uncharacterized protein n=1 Tax=Spirosoma foliorum TaxID=2710596 RepID=A0A7G5H2R7_9BACT|nr:hypothetical protein [Spirosoma foliorum]QMW05409.1 hypothetical protein H3H32_11205 [Spirosoma foliorum]
MSESSITFAQADLLLGNLLEKFLLAPAPAYNDGEKILRAGKARGSIKDAQTRALNTDATDEIAHTLHIGENLVNKFVRTFWDTRGNRQKNGFAEVEQANVLNSTLYKLGKKAFPSIKEPEDHAGYAYELLKKLSLLLEDLPPITGGVEPDKPAPNPTVNKINLLRKGSYRLFYRNVVDGSIGHNKIDFKEHTGKAGVVEISNGDKMIFHGTYTAFNDDRYLGIKLKRRSKVVWSMNFDLGNDDSGAIPNIILGISHRFSPTDELISGAAVLTNLQEQAENVVTDFLNRQEYAPIKIPKEFFVTTSDMEKWLTSNSAKHKSTAHPFHMEDNLLKNLAGDYVYFALKIPSESDDALGGKAIPNQDQYRFIKAELRIETNGAAYFSGIDYFESKIEFEGTCQYSQNEVLQINLHDQGKRGRLLTLQAYLVRERLQTPIKLPIIGISLWREEYLEGKIIALVRKHPDDRDATGIIGLYPQADLQKRILNDQLYDGVLSYLSGKVNRFLHTPRKFHKGPFRPHQENHRRLYFGLAFYLASRKPVDSKEEDAWSKKVKSALHEAWLHGFAASHFAGFPLEEAIRNAKKKEKDDDSKESLFGLLVKDLQKVFDEQQELKTVMKNELKEFIAYASDYWSFLKEP